MQTEYQALMKNGTWKLVPFTGQQVVDNKWVFKMKFKSNGMIERHKARLVAKGFQQSHCVNFKETFIPVPKSTTIRILLTIAVSLNWSIKQLDVNNAFLNGQLSEEVYMKQPKGFEDPKTPNHVCKLVKVLYGLRQPPRAWFDKLITTLV